MTLIFMLNLDMGWSAQVAPTLTNPHGAGTMGRLGGMMVRA